VTRLLALAAAAAAALALVPAALADGDPASDYLITQPAFLPFDSKVDKANAQQLAALLADAQRKGFPIRVAVIASKVDLGAVPVLYRKPQTYARFLGQELFYFYKHKLLVVMPNGFGVYAHGPAPKGDIAALAKLPPPNSTDGNVLVAAADRAVRTLARRRGIELSAAPAPSSSGSSSNHDRLVLAGGLLALAAVIGLAFVAVRIWRRS
jgi:hypothetical protein